MKRRSVIVGSAIYLTLLTLPAWAVKAQNWTHEQPSQFLAGKLENVVVSSQGEVMLGREAKILYKAEKEAEIVNALVQAGDGMIYAATGPKGIIYKIDGEKVTKFATLPEGGSALSLVFAQDGRLLVGTGGGDQAKIYVIDGKGEVRIFHEPAGTRYVWAMARGPDGKIYAATGIEGQLHAIEPDGKKSKVLADLKPKNLLCLAYGPDDMLYAGTDEEGLVYRINPVTGGLFVMYDAAEPEISDIVTDNEGNLFVSTASADQARPGRAVADKPGGQPEPSGKEGDEVSPQTKPTDDDSETKGSSPGKKTEKKKEGDKTKIDLKVATTRKVNGTARVVGRSAIAAPAGGNAIYRIDTDGFVTEIFREPVMILAMAEVDGTLFAATGNEGRLYAITPHEDRTTMIAKLEPNQANALLHLPSGSLIVGTANAPMLILVSPGNASKGTLVSKPLNANQIVKWGRISWDANIPAGTKLTVATRTGNVENEESDAWDAWSAELDATAPRQIMSVGARFLQYRLTFETTVPGATATLRKLTLAWIEENCPPQISELAVLTAREEAKQPTGTPKAKALMGALAGFGQKAELVPDSHWVVKWRATDPNNDELRYQVFYRALGARRWIRIAKELTEPVHMWDSRTVSDGKYQARVVADDGQDNPPGNTLKDARISDTILVDNTPPEITIDRFERQGKSSLVIHATATDNLFLHGKLAFLKDNIFHDILNGQVL